MKLSNNQVKWLKQILCERFGVNFSLKYNDKYFILTVNESEKKIIISIEEDFYKSGKTQLKCYDWEAYKEGLKGKINGILKAPSKFKLTEPLIEFNSEGAIIKYDILGLTYWMLNRLEEIDRNDLDSHNRFPAVNSHAYNYDYLERPIVDEWLDILGQVITRTWPLLEFKQHKFCMKLTHDVDRPSRYGFRTIVNLIKGLLKDIIIKKNIISIYNCILTRKNIHSYIHKKDPANTFEWIMDQSERKNLQSTFYFICGLTCKEKDADYDIEHPAMIKLMKDIHERGHRIGLHPSYNTYCNFEQLNLEASKLRNVMQKNNIVQSDIGGRMHYLRWKHPITLLNCESANLTYDTSLGYADRPGFRCGTCYEYPAFDHLNQKILKIRLLPLIAMEGTIIDKRYLGLGLSEDAFNKFETLKQRCKSVNGCYTLLWHNTELIKEENKAFYMRLIS